MKLSITVVDQRPKPDQPAYQARREMETYNRVDVSEMQADRVVLAGLLRSIADSLDPQVEAVR